MSLAPKETLDFLAPKTNFLPNCRFPIISGRHYPPVVESWWYIFIEPAFNCTGPKPSSGPAGHFHWLKMGDASSCRCGRNIRTARLCSSGVHWPTAANHTSDLRRTVVKGMNNHVLLVTAFCYANKSQWLQLLFFFSYLNALIVYKDYNYSLKQKH